MGLTVSCVNVENYLGRGQEYVNKLRESCKRNLNQPFAFSVLSISQKSGWWAKVDLFRHNAFKGRVLYLDLDTVITGPLDPIVEHKGLLHLGDWGWPTNDYGSGVMVWDAGEHSEIYELYNPTVPERFRGDQDWLTALGGWDALPAGLNVSYRYHAKDGPPEGASTVSFHGLPKPHELPAEHWVHQHWKT